MSNLIFMSNNHLRIRGAPEGWTQDAIIRKNDERAHIPSGSLLDDYLQSWYKYIWIFKWKVWQRKQEEITCPKNTASMLGYVLKMSLTVTDALLVL